MRRLMLVAMLIPLFAHAHAEEHATITIAAAASLKYAVENTLIPMFHKKYPGISVEATYDSSGKLQAQIENGLDADVFLPASKKQMDALIKKNLVDQNSVRPVLENKIVLIQPANSDSDNPLVTSFENAANAKIIAIGDPKSVPAGQYAQEIFTALGTWETIKNKASMGTNVTEVLNWVAEESADAGVVYATDAATTTRVAIVEEAPDGTLKEKVLYPVGILAGSKHKDEAKMFIEFLTSNEAMAVFERHGFTSAL